MRSESTPRDSQPPPKPPAIPGCLPQSPNDCSKPSYTARLESLNQDISSILKNTEWPADSTNASKGLLDTIHSPPDISHTTVGMNQELQLLVEQYIRILGEIRIRLKDASSKSEMKRWKFLERIRSLASNHPSKCTLLFQTCQDDVSKIGKALNDRLDYEQAKEDEHLDGPPKTLVDSAVQPHAPDPPTELSQQGTTAPDAAFNPFPTQQPQSSTHQDRRERGPISDTALTIARKTFKSVEIASGAIPVAGSYVGAAAKVGLAFVEMLQTMDRNHSLAIDLGDHTSRLTKLLDNFKEKSSADEQNIVGQIKDLHEELGRVGAKVEEWSSSGRFTKAFSAREHAEALKEYQAIIRTVREEMQLLVSLDCRNIVIELENIEVRKERRRLLDRLGDGQYGARGNTLEDIICFPGTRMELLKRINDWIRDSTLPSPVLWIRGMAGRGKSTITSTVVHTWKSRASCAIFHFRRGQNAVNSRFICALARQLGSSLVSEVKEAVLESVREDQDIADPGRRLDEQFGTLFVAPFAKLKNHRHPILIVVDALDECNNPKDAVDFVRLVDRHSSSFPTNVKFLLTCRPETIILRNLEPKHWCKEDLDLALDMNDDLSRFLRAACTNIRNDHDLSEDWPSPGDIEKLVQMSQGLFQWARTAITYISDGSPTDRLRALLRRPSAWSGLDDLYHQILSKAFNSLRLDPTRQDILSRVLGTLVVAPHAISLEVIATLYEKHEIFDGENRENIIPFLRKDILADLNSLLLIPDSPSESMRLMHTSIHDLLSSELRCNQQPFYVDSARCHHQLANACFEIMLSSLKENICNLSDLSKPASEARDVVEQELPSGVQYCCQAWSTHLMQGVRWPESHEKVTAVEHFKAFSEGKIMYWLEMMSLIGATKEAIITANHIHQWLSERAGEATKSDGLAALWNDVRRFITTFLEPISFGPLHIYISALPHCPRETGMWNLYGKHAKVSFLHGHQMSKWPSNLWTRSPNREVKTVAFSPDGRVLAFGSSDGVVRLLDAQTGAPVGEPFTGHSETVWSVCFSPNGKFLASGSDDRTVRLWNIESGTVVGEPLMGHTGGVNSVCFRPDGRVLASGSDDETVRIWDSENGAAMGESLTGHSERVWSVCFSAGGKLLASGSDDSTVRLWDPHASVPVGEPLTCHGGRVLSVGFSSNGNLRALASEDKTVRLWATNTKTLVGESPINNSGNVASICFSPDGAILASGSHDGTIRLWNTQTGAAMGEPLTGHSGWVWSVCFSPDGKLLASGSDDKTVRLWDPQAGAAVAGSLISHRAKVNSICFSPDGKRVASRYDDGTIRLWDAQTGAAVGEPRTGHSDKVNSVCFSPDGNLLASGSADRTIRLWDAQTGEAKGEPLSGHRRRVRSVCFSPDGNLLASGSDDETVQLWDPRTGAAVGDPLRGHNDWVRSVCFSPDGKYLASASSDQTIRLWDPQTRVAVGEPLAGHSEQVMSVSFSPDGTLLLARCYDGSTATWDIATRQRCDTARSPPSYANPRFRDHWVTFDSSRFLWLPPQYWNTEDDCVALSNGQLFAFQNGSLSILDVSQILPPK